MKKLLLSYLKFSVFHLIIGFNVFAYGQAEGTIINGNLGFSQIGGTPINPSAIVEMKSTNKGMLIPRLNTSQINSVISPTQGLILYDTDLKCVKTYNGSSWECLNSPVLPANTPPSTSLALKTTGDLYSYGESIAVDGSNNIYITGHFTGTLTFGKGTNVGTITSSGNQDAFIVKLSPSGDYIWATNITGTNNQESFDIVLDNSGNIYVAGYLQGNTAFNSTNGSTQTFVTSFSYEQIFVAKYNPLGNLTWYKTTTQSVNNNSRAQGLALDINANPYISGYYQGNITFGTTTLNSVSSSVDIFVARLNASDGNFVWAKTAGGASDSENGFDIVIDNSGNTYLTGWYSGSSTFGASPTNVTYTSRGGRDIFLAKYNSSGDFQWARTAGSINEDYGNGIAYDNTNNFVYLTGSFLSSTLTFGTGIGTNPLTSLGSYDIFLTKYDNNGNLSWAIQSGSPDADYGRKVAVDSNGNPYIFGTFRGVANFKSVGNTNNFYLVPSNYTEPFIAKYNPTGILQWAVAAIGGGYDDEAYGMTIKNNAVYSIGNFKATQNFSYQQLTSTNNYNGDIYIWKYSE